MSKVRHWPATSTTPLISDNHNPPLTSSISLPQSAQPLTMLTKKAWFTATSNPRISYSTNGSQAGEIQWENLSSPTLALPGCWEQPQSLSAVLGLVHHSTSHLNKLEVSEATDAAIFTRSA